MHIPQVSLATTIAPVSTLDVGLHKYVNLSWHVLLPYTFLGAFLMTYSQYKLVKGQKALKSTRKSKLAKVTKSLKIKIREYRSSQYKAIAGLLKAS